MRSMVVTPIFDVTFNPFSNVTFSGIKDPIPGHGDIRMLVTMSDKELSRIMSFSQLLKSACAVVMQLSCFSDRTSDTASDEPLSRIWRSRLANLRRGRPGNHRLPESLKYVFFRYFTTITATLDQHWPQKITRTAQHHSIC